MVKKALLRLLVYGIAAIPIAIIAQTPAQDPNGVRFNATTENVSGAGEAIRINLSRWSTDADRDELVNAWTLKAPAAPARGGGGGGARGGRGGRGADVVDDPAADDPDNPASRFGRGGARGRGGADAAAAPSITPERSLAAVLKKKPSVGMFWTSETVGYSIKYAYRLPQPDGSERIILATDRRIGAWSNLWKLLSSANPTEYEFSIIELRLNPKGEGEGKASLTGRAGVDAAAKTLALESYNTLPVILKGVKRQ
jgi:hypothetical protein